MRRTAVLTALTVGPLATLVALTSPATAAVPFAQADFSGYSTGTAIHVDAGQLGAQQLAQVEVGYSGATVASKGTNTITQGAAPLSKPGIVVNEVSQTVQPKLPGSGKMTGDRSYGRGAGLEVGVGTALPSDSPAVTDALIANKVQVSAPASQKADTTFLTVPASPVAYAQAVRGQAVANWNESSCVLGAPLSSGTGYAADARVLEATANQPVVGTHSPQGQVTSSYSQTILDRATTSDQKPIATATGLALRSETRQVEAPVVLFEGTANQIQIEVVPLTLQAVAGGVAGSAYVRYAPDAGTGPTTPIVRITTGLPPAQQVTQITSQQFFGNEGLEVPAGPLAVVKVGTPPHLIGDGTKPAAIAADGTSAAAAVDAVSVSLLAPDATTHLADVRVGHMEARATVPAGGIECSIPVTKTSNPAKVTAGDKFVYTITITNPFDCVLSGIKVTDSIEATGGVKFSILSTDPAATKTANTATFSNVPDVAPHSSGSVQLTVLVDKASAAGKLTDHVKVDGTCGPGAATGSTVTTTGAGPILLAGNFTLIAPSVGPGVGIQLPRTGPGAALPLAGLLLLTTGGVLLRRRWAGVTG